jgi:hypothetical protein
MGSNASEAVFVLVRFRRGCRQDEAREERRHGVGKDDLSHDPVLELLPTPHVVVPVPKATIVLQVLEGVLVARAPRVEVVPVAGVEVLPVLGMAPSGVGIGRNDRVVVAHGSPSTGRCATQ